MALVSVRCQNCGAPLQAPPEARYLTCTHCSSQLEVHYNSSVAYTTLLENIDRNIAATARDVEVIKIQNELERTDREWQMTRENFTTTDEHGHRSVPTRNNGVIGVILTLVVGIGMAILMAKTEPPAPFLFVPLVIIIIGIANGISTFKKADQLEFAERKYRARRQSLIHQMNKSGEPHTQPPPRKSLFRSRRTLGSLPKRNED